MKKQKASKATVVNQTKKATLVHIASELGLDTQGTKAELMSRIEDALTVIPAHVSDESRAVLQRLGYEDAVQETGGEGVIEKELEEPLPRKEIGSVDRLEIRPMRIVENDNRKEVVEPCDKEIAEFWALYLKLPDGTQEWISDHDTPEDATDHFQKLGKSGQLDETLSALKVAKKILSDGKKSPVPATQVRSMGDVAIRLQYFGLPQKALKLYLKVLDRIDEVNVDPHWQATQLWCLGTTCKVLGNEDMATQYIAEAIDRGSIVDGDGKLVIWQHILNVWKDELRTLYREELKQRIIECVKKYTICSTYAIYRFIKWEEKKEIDDCFASLLIDKRIKKKQFRIFSKPLVFYYSATIEA